MRSWTWSFKKVSHPESVIYMSDDFYAPVSSLFPQEIFEVDRDEAIRKIAAVVADMLDDDPNMLMSYLYRLDVDEGRIKVVMAYSDTSDIATGLATLILDRQLARIRTQREFQQNK